MPNLKVLYLKGNPIIRSISFYRKKMIKELENLTYLDDRPVDEGDRISTNAFFTGGMEAEKKAREDYRKGKDNFFRFKKVEDLSEPFEERKKRTLDSLRIEYLSKKENLENKKRSLMREIEIYPDRKNEIIKNLQSIDYQIDENEKFKINEESDFMSAISRRENVDLFSTFQYESWMDSLLENHVVENLFDFSRALKLIRLDLKTRSIKNWELFNEFDLRSKWTEFEINKFKLLEINTVEFS